MFTNNALHIVGIGTAQIWTRSLLNPSLHILQTRSSDDNFVCRSNRLSNKRVDCDKTEEKSVQILYPTKDHLAYFLRKRMVDGATLLPKISGQPAPAGAKSPILNRYSLVAAQW